MDWHFVLLKILPLLTGGKSCQDGDADGDTNYVSGVDSEGVVQVNQPQIPPFLKWKQGLSLLIHCDRPSYIRGALDSVLKTNRTIS